MFKVVDPETRKRVSMTSFPTRETAEQAITEWIKRGERGGRKDLPLEMLRRLRVQESYTEPLDDDEKAALDEWVPRVESGELTLEHFHVPALRAAIASALVLRQRLSNLAEKLVADHTNLHTDLVSYRSALQLPTADIAARMGVSEETVVAFERYDADPTLSQLRRYALAIGVKFSTTLEVTDLYVGELTKATA